MICEQHAPLAVMRANRRIVPAQWRLNREQVKAGTTNVRVVHSGAGVGGGGRGDGGALGGWELCGLMLLALWSYRGTEALEGDARLE